MPVAGPGPGQGAGGARVRILSEEGPCAFLLCLPKKNELEPYHSQK